MHRQAQCTMNNSTRYKDHPQQQALEVRMGGKAKLLVCFFIIIIINSICGLGTFFSGAKKNNRS